MILSDKDIKEIETAIMEIRKGKDKNTVVTKYGFRSWGQLYQSAYYLHKLGDIKITWRGLRKELLKQGGIKRRKLRGKETDISAKYVKQLLTTRELAKEYSVSKATIQEILRKNNVARSASRTNLLRPFSGKDKKRKIKIPDYPNKISPDLADYIGIKIADGWTRKNRFNVGFSFNIEEKEYVYNVVIPLINRIYGIAPIVEERPTDSSIELNINSKTIYKFETEILGFPKGKKNKTIKIPKEIMSSPKLYTYVLRGIIDNDFGAVQVRNKRSLLLSTSMKAPLLTKQLKNISKSLGFNLRIRKKIYFDKRTKKRYESQNMWFPPSETGEIFRTIGLRNPRNLSKFMLSQRFGMSPTRTTLEERLKCLSGQISFEELMNISEERKFNQSLNAL